MITMQTAKVGTTVSWLSLDGRREGRVVQAGEACIVVCFPATATCPKKTVRLPRVNSHVVVKRFNEYRVVVNKKVATREVDLDEAVRMMASSENKSAPWMMAQYMKTFGISNAAARELYNQVTA